MDNINSDPVQKRNSFLSRYKVEKLSKFIHFVLLVFLLTAYRLLPSVFCFLPISL
jgi:hypothetical protein